jgi:hypothetical protein
VPSTFAKQKEVPVVKIEAGVQATANEVMVMGVATEMVADPDLEASCTDVAVIFAFPTPEGVKNPVGVMDPPVADQVTAAL